MKQLEILILLKLKEVTKVTPEEITLLVSELTKDIAIGFAEYCDINKRMSMEEYDVAKPIKIHIKSFEQLFNEYLNILK